jgi:hypothetical protein
MQRRELLALLLSSTALACTEREPAVPTTSRPRNPQEEARQKLHDLSLRYELLMQEHGEHEWARYAGKLKEGPVAQQKMKSLRESEQEVFREAEAILKRFGDSVTTPRRADLWRRGALGLKLLGDPRSAELSDELEAVINNHQFVLDGTTYTRKQMAEMRRSDDAKARRNVRRLEHTLHLKAAPIATELIVRRREMGRDLEEHSFHVALLEVRGIKARDSWQVMDALHLRTQRKYFDIIKQLRGVSEGALLPWDMDYAVKKLFTTPDERFDPTPALAKVFAIYQAFGIDLKKTGPNITVRDFAFNGQTIAVKIPGDVRLVIRPNPGMRYYATLLHELGHAVSDHATRETDPLFKTYEWVPGLVDPAYAEGIAEIFGRLLDEPAILMGHLGLSEDETTRVVAARKAEAALSIRRGWAFAHFEHLILEQPNINMDQLSLAIERQETGLPLPRDAEPTWATSPFLATYPVYTQSSQLAAALAVQVRDTLKVRFGAQWISPAAGKWIQDALCADGARWTLREKLVRATGRPLDPEPVIKWVISP